jgi:hypothetical protein
MLLRLPCSAERERTNHTFFPHCAALITVLSWLLLFNACGSSAPANRSTVPTNAPGSNSSPNLTVSATLPAASVGSTYNATVAVTGGTAPYAFSVASGGLPHGVLLAPNSGAISGTPSASGTFSFALSVSDSKGLSKQQPLQITVSNSPAPPAPAPPPTPPAGQNTGSSFSNVQHSGGWSQFGQGPPNFVDCSPSPCNGIAFSMTQGVSSPSMGGQSTVFWLGGATPYSDALWNNQLIGTGSTQGVPDANQTLVPTLRNFTYDVYFYGANLGLSQALEFDINQFFNGMGFIFGHECRIAGGNEWDVWDNQNKRWTPTGIPCHPNDNSWNHVTIKVQRTSNDDLLYQSITFNGVKSDLNWTFGHGSAPGGWYGVTINYQMDGNLHQDPHKVYLDNLTFSYQ